MPGWHIAVSGLIGSGKTTLVAGLARELGAAAFEEKASDNPYLARFYQEPQVWAFRSYVYFLHQTFEDYRRARSNPRGGVQERVLEEHLVVFGAEFHRRGYLDDADFKVLESLTSTAVDLVPRPDLLIHLEVDPAEAQRRLRQRAVAAEDGIELAYLQSLNDRYEPLLANWSGDVLRVDGMSHDFRNEEDVATLASRINRRLTALDAA